MTAGAVTSASVTPVSVRAVRSFIGRRRHRRWFDWYAIGFLLVIGSLYLADFLASPLSRLSLAAGHAATQAAATQAVTGAGLVTGAGAGLLLLAQALGPLALSPADASWLLLSPLDRRGVLRRSAASVGAVAALAGALLGVLTLAMMGPYLHPAGGTLPATWLVLSAVAGAGSLLAAVSAEILAQPVRRLRPVVRGGWAVVALLAVGTAVAGQHSPAVADAVTRGFGGLSTSAFIAAAVSALVLALIAGIALWRLLPRFPAGVLRTDSARAGRALTAAAFLNLQLLSWMAEDEYWRGRPLRSRAWPRLPPALALAWADWRRLGRRPWTLAVIAVAAVAPALAGTAITGRYQGWVIAGTLVVGGIAAGAQGTTATKRDLNDPVLRRLLGVSAGAAFAARTVLPGLLSTAWLGLACIVLTTGGVLSGWLWPLAGVAAGPALAAAALRMARTAPVNPAEPALETAVGPISPWQVTRVLSLILGVIGSFPLLRAVERGQLHGTTVIVQLVVSAVLLGGYVLLAGGQG